MRERVLTLAMLTGLAALSPLPAAGEEEGGGPRLVEKRTKAESFSIEGLAYIRYWYDIRDSAVEAPGEEEAHENSFELWRFYFGAGAKLAPWLSARFTTDVGPEKEAETTTVSEHSHEVPGDDAYRLFVKFAWLEARLVDGLFVRAGIVDNPYHSAVEDFWRYRYVSRNAGEEEKFWDSADAGAYLRWEIPAGLGSAGAGVANGAGFKHALDQDAEKTAWLFARLTPLATLGKWGKSFSLSGYAGLPLAGDEGSARTYSGLAGYSDSWVTAGYQVMLEDRDSGSTRLGHAAYLRFDTPWKVGLLSRLATWDPDTGSDEKPARYAALGGVSWSPHPLLSVAAAGSVSWWSAEDPSAPKEEEIKAMVCTELRF